MMKKSNERGVALLFALGMLTLLLVTGMAFVANALSAQKVAANNSARTQARMFAQSALSRMMASIMVYQSRVYNQTGADGGKFPESFDGIYSHAGESGDTDGLVGSDSLMGLPETDNSMVAVSIAKKFNEKFTGSSWPGSWVYFYDRQGSGKQIVGRAAWQVLSASPEILAPVFWSGHLQTDGTPNWKPREHRWGREIDEVFLDSTNIFKNVSGIITSGDVVRDLAALYDKLGITGDVDQKWVERWLMPDVKSSSVMRPTPIHPEVYSYEDGNKRIQLLRFNISEILKENLTSYGVSANADPWYARLGIDSSATAVNNDAAVERLTLNSPEAAAGETFDYAIRAADRPSLPFLRRIGNFSADNPTFANVTAWRKQIAANFNDYCDADNVPTSDVAADTWMNELVVGSDGKFVQPSYTGNEKTPYLYELGFNMAVHPGTATTVNSSKTGFDMTEFSKNASNSYEHIPDIWLSMDAMVKLANIYVFDPTSLYDKFTAGVDLGRVELDFKPTHVSLNLTYEVDGNSSTYTCSSKAVPASMSFSTIKAYIDGKSFGTLKLTADNAAVRNSGEPTAKKPYPFLITEDGAMIAHKAKRLSLDGNVSFKLDAAILKDLGFTLPAGAEIVKFTINVDAVEVSRVAVNINRMYLSGNDLKLGKEVGLDYVRAFDNAVEWNSEGGATAKILPQADSGNEKNIPGIIVGGIRNYDPRQNLNPGDWYKKLVVHAVANCIKFKSEVNSGTSDVLADLHHVMSVAETTAAGKCNEASSNDTAPETANTLFRPYPATGEDYNRDLERAGEPAWMDNDDGADSEKHLSTAFIRNAPMMSPWEIGFIHRGVRWQTINIKSSCDPDNNGNPVSMSTHKPVAGWDKSGTCYKSTTDAGVFSNGGDGAILDQIKMTDLCLTYGKINVNNLREASPDFDADRDIDIVRALFEKIRFNQPVFNFYKASTRQSGSANSGDFGTDAESGTEIPGDEVAIRKIFDGIKALPDELVSRSAFIAAARGNLVDAFQAVTVDGTDAAQEEIVGKTINLLSAEKPSPTQIYVVVVAQSIRDVAGMQYRKNADGTDASKDCNFGTFDREGDVYFDEITGEVKMFVTIDRDINTGRMVIRRIDYLE